MAAQYQNPSEYIAHHLTFAAKPIGEGGFWTVHLDTLIVSALLGLVGIGFFWWIAKDATSGVPGKKQAFIELVFDFITGQVKGIFHGDPHKFVAPLRVTVSSGSADESMDFLPADGWRSSPARSASIMASHRAPRPM